MVAHQDMVFLGEFTAHPINKGITMRYFNSNTMTEVLPGTHDITGAISLPDDNWFFTSSSIPQGKMLAVNENGEPILIDATDLEQ